MIRDILFLPHGMQIIEGVEDDPLEGFMWLNEQMKAMIDPLQVPKQVILLTPHGYNLDRTMVLYNHTEFEGSLFKLENSVVHGEFLERFEFHGSTEMIAAIQQAAESADLPLEVLTHGYPAYPLQLNWGTAVPLYYFKQHAPDIQVTILCYPRSRHSDLDGIASINSKLMSVLDSLEDEVMLLISGDLSHVHREDGPYGYHDSGVPFDTLIMDWVESGLNDQMDRILQMQPTALACGMSGLQLIHQLREKGDFPLRTSFYKVPTYFGMAGAHWSRD
ncbi:MAG: DODA-type extradiol aromatic ring-opening family dioxygenase [Candidatus Kariarchaeaceae archaeon]|jgi:aromatic ring-opening dioxygenase LigB subunit